MSETPSTNYSMIQPRTSESEQSLSGRPLNVTEPVVAKRICFYKSGDPQFNGVKMVVNSRSFKSFDALLDNLSKRVPLPFGVRNITTPRGIHSITNLEDLEDGKSYICSQQRKVKPINLEMASKKPLPWQISRPISGRRRAIQLAREGEGGIFQRGGTVRISTPKKLLVFKNGDVRIRRTIILGKKNTQNFEAFLDHISELMQYPVVKLYATDGRKVSSFQALILCSGAVVAAGREPFKAGNYDPHRYSLPGKLPGISNRVYPRTNVKPEDRKMSLQIDPHSRAQMFSASSCNDNNSDSSYVPDSDMGLAENHSHAGEDLFVVPSEDDIEKSVHLNQDGSMTVEMRVRFKVKEEETIKWTTTVSRAGLSGDRNAKMGTSTVVEEDQSPQLNILTCIDNREDFNSAEDDVALQQISTEVTDQDSECGMKTHNYDIWQSPSMNTDLSQSNNNNVTSHFYRPPTPGPRRVRQKKALVESVTLVSDTAVQKKMVGQFSYSEEMDNGEAKSEYCVVTHASTKSSSVTNPKHNEICSNHAMKQSLEDPMEEEMLNKVDHKATIERSLEVCGGDGLLQNVFEKSVVKEALYNSLTTSCHSSISSAQSSPRKCHLRQILTKESGAPERELSSFNSHSEWSQSKSVEKICNQCKLSHSSQASTHLSPAENNKTVFQCAQMTPTVSGSSSISTKNDTTEYVTKIHFSDESQATSSNSKKKTKKKKKKRKSSSDTMELAVGSQQNLHDISVEGTARSKVKACEMHVTRDNTQHSSTQITIHKRMVEFPVGNSDGSNKILGTKEDVYSPVSMKPQQDELGPDLRQNLNRPLPKIQSRSDINLSPSSKQEEVLLLVKDNAKTEVEQVQEDAHDTTNLTEQTPSCLASLNSLTEIGHGHKVGTEKGKITPDKSHKSSTKPKKTKMNKKIEGALGSKIKESDETSTLDTFRHADFTDEIMEHSLENYVQMWLQNIFPNVVMPAKHLAPINSNDIKMYQLSVKSFSDKESQLVEKSDITEEKLSNSALNHLSKIGVIEESVQELYERHIDCLRDADASIIEEAEYLLEPDIQNGTELSKSNVIHENDRKKIQPGIDNKSSSDDQRCSSETVAQVDPKAINNNLGTDVQKDCVSGLLLHQLKSAMFNVENNHIGCIEKSCCLTDTSSPSLLGSSSDLLIAWLLLLNLKEKLFNMCKDDMVQTTCSCSEILMLLQYLKQVAIKEEAEDLKAAVSNLQECTGNRLVFSGMQIEKQELAYCQENASLVEIKNIPDSKKQGKLSESLIFNDIVSSKKAAKELTEELESSSEGQETCSVPVENSNLNDLDVHSTEQNPNSTAAESNNYDLISNEELSKENEDSSLQESQGRNTDTSFNNEESGISEDPNSTIYSMTSNDKDHIFDLETSELDDKELDSTEKQKSCTELWEEENSSEHLILTAENLTNCDREEKSVQEDLEEDGTCEESPEQLSPLSPLSFCYESKQIPVDACEEELTSRVKQIVKELECGSHSNSCFDFKKCLKSPATSDLSDYRPETDDSDYNVRPSSDLTNESTEEGIYEEYNKGYVKRTIERLYGKTEASFWPTSKSGPPYMAHTLQKDMEESFHQVMEEAPSLCQAHNTWCDEKVSPLASYEIPGDISSDMWRKENATLPAPQFSLNGEEAYYSDECSGQYTSQYCQSKPNVTTEDGVLTDKGKWLLKENHLIRRSPPETAGMYGYADTTSADTAFDNHSDDIPYSHFGNLDLRPPLKEISSSELEDMAKPCSKQCNYFNMPHNSDSEPFPDDLSIKSKNSQYGSSLHSEAIRKVCTTSTQHCTEISSPNSAFASIRLSDNKVHPIPIEQPSPDEPIQVQPTSNTNSNRNTQEDEDSLDKLHAICGQHCPILTAVIMPTNEEIRGCAYRKASDVENQVGLRLLTNAAHSVFQGKGVISLDKNHAGCCINKIANNIFLRRCADNTLDFINGHNFSLFVSAALKENQGFKDFNVGENMDANAQEINNPESPATQEASSEITAVQNNNVSVFQHISVFTSSVNQIVGERPSPSFVDITEGCRSGTLYHCGTLDKIDWEVTVQLEDENTLNIKEETLSYVMEDERSNDHSDFPKAEWKVIVLTSDQPSASTTSQVYVTLYGDQTNSGAIFLYGEGERVFERGNTDTFTIHTEDIGNLYKIRIGHNNSGETPAWHCKELQLQNLVTGEQFTFPVHRWLAQDQEDCEICQELPVLHQGQPLLPVAVYEVHVVTGDLWNGGTEADIYVSVYGEKGDTGSRQLHRSKKPKKYVKGQTDIFLLEAVHLGHLHKIVVGHNGLGSGNGWFLEKIVIKDPITNSDYTFACHRWLDQGEDDGEIVRELYAIDNNTLAVREELEIKKAEMWAAEKWKFQKGNMLQFYNKVTHGFIHLSPDGTVDALGDKKDKYGLFDVTIKKGNTFLFICHPMPHLALALAYGSVTGMEKGDIRCELQVHLQPNRCAVLESARNPGQTVAFNLQGTVTDDATGYAGLTKEFVVHVKGVFHDSAIILLTTSYCQSLCLRPDGSCSGAGNQSDDSYWRVHKVSSGVCMFESVKNPRMYLRIKDGQCNGTGTGDVNCHFKVEKNLESGSVSLESSRNKGIYVGLLPDGQTKPVVHTGERNILFYPQVIQFGREKPMGTSATPGQKEVIKQQAGTQSLMSYRRPYSPPPKEVRTIQVGESPFPSDDKWKVSVLTGNSGTQANVTLWIYGDKGIAGPITLGKDNRDQLFLPRMEDTFQVEIKHIGNIYKIRIGHDGTSKQSEWMLEKVKLQHLKSGKILNFPANKWLSRSRGNGDTICELPLVERGRSLYSIVYYQVYVYTGHLEQAETDSSIYLCIYGERGDSGLRLLHRSDKPVKFQRGMVDMFEIQAVSLGNLQKVLLCCEANNKSQYWYCEKVIIREPEKNSEYIFSCERWLPFMSQGKIHSEIELFLQEMQINRQPKMEEENGEDWKITVVTGGFETAGTTATVSLYAYGENKASGPLILGSGKHQLFNRNSVDTFKIDLKDIGELYKIRIGHDNSGSDPSWHINEIRLQRVNSPSEQEKHFPLNCWLAEDQDDGDTWREIPIRSSKKGLLPLVLYSVGVYTGSNPGAETNSNVYITIFGSRGDSGKRKLHKSFNNKIKFRCGQTDVFHVKAVSLGVLNKIFISHDGTGPDSGWFLQKINIKFQEGKEGGKEEVVFPCNRWLDEYQDDGKTKRELIAKKNSNASMLHTGGQWRVLIKSARDSPEPRELKRTLVIYGSKGKSEDLLLFPQSSGRVCFQPGATDEFLIESGDVGDVYKIRVSCDDLPDFEGWHLKSFHMEELHTNQEVNFDCSCWFSHSQEHRELVKEFPAVNENQKSLPVHKYIVSVHTGDLWGAETFASLYVTLYGERGDTGVRKLQHSFMAGENVQRSKVDSFIVEAVSLGQLKKIVVGHDGEGYGAGIYLKMITVKKSENSDKEWLFPCWNWLDTHLGLCDTVCEIKTIGKRLTSCSKHPQINTQSSSLWIMDIIGSDMGTEIDPLQLTFRFYGDNDCKKLAFQISGQATQIKDELKHTGSLYKVQIQGPHAHLKEPWHLSMLHMKHTGTNQEMWLMFDCWFKPSEEKCIELPTFCADQDPLPVVEYSIHVHTGDKKKADASGDAYLCIQGDRGDSGKQWLNDSKRGPLSFDRGQVDFFKITAVHLGMLNQVLVGFKSLKKDDWFLEKIVIKEGSYPFTTYIFLHNNWINKHSKTDFTELVIPLQETNVTSGLVKDFDVRSQGQWRMWVDCAHIPEKLPDIDVLVHGTNGTSVAQRVQNLKNEPFLLTVGDVGRIIKISFILSSQKLRRGIKLVKLRMKDLDTKEELGFYPLNQWLFEEDGSEAVAERAAVRPNEAPLKEVTYSISVYTGTLPASETDADIFITLFGENGDCSKRKLRNSKSCARFEKGQVSTFNLHAIDLGILSEVHVEHNRRGYGAGWYLDQITIQDPEKHDGCYVFSCQQWLDSGVGDGKIKRELQLLGKVRKERLAGNVHGTWDVTVMSRNMSSNGMNPKLTLTACDDKGASASVCIPKGSFKRAEAYQASLDLDKKFSMICKVRLEVEDTDGETWRCRKVKLQHRKSKETLEFPCLRDFSDAEGYTMAELPVLTDGCNFLTVRQYDLYISTDTSPGSGTDADVYVTLRGSMGDSGRRKLARNGEDVFTKGKVDVFQVKAVDIGTLHELVVEKGKGSDWHLEKIIVKEPKFSGRNILFMAQTWLRDRIDRKSCASVTLNVTEIQEWKSMTDSLLQNQQMKSEGSWKIYFTKCLQESSKEYEKSWENILKLIMVFYGSSGKSEPISVGKTIRDQAENQITCDVRFPSELGMLYKVKFGLHHLGASTSQLFHHCKMQNTVTLDTFSLSINKTLPLLNGDQWIELPVEWPLREALSMVTYHVTVFSNDILSKINLVHISLCIYGTNGDTEDRPLLLSLPSVTQKDDNESCTGQIDAVDLGDLHKVTLLIGSKSSGKLSVKALHLKEAPKQEPVYVFEVNETFHLDANVPEIRREIALSLITKEDGEVEDLAEHIIKVYTGDKRGAGTDANVHIILFGDKDSSQLIQLNKSLDHRDPFERGKTDTFRIKTKKVGRLQKIEIGHDGKGFASGWFLDKVEITDTSTNDHYCFSCNRWLAEDENDGRTVVQLYA